MVLKYPSDLSSRYYLSLNFQKYQRPDPFTQAINLIQPNPGSSICLPMPAELRNRLDLNWDNTAKLNPIAELGLDTMQLHPSAGAAILSANEIGGKILPGLLGGTAAAIASVISGKNLEGQVNNIANKVEDYGQKIISDGLQRVGLAMNPILTVQFKSPKFKVYSFSWRFSPDNSTDDNNLDAIIQIIDYNAKPSVEWGGAFFGYPSIATIQLVTPKSEYGLFKIQPCVITSFEVNYAPHGIPSFLAATGHAAVIDIKMEILEIVLNTRDNGNSQTNLALQNNPVYAASTLQTAISDLTPAIQNFASGINGITGSLETAAISAASSSLSAISPLGSFFK